MGRRLRLLFGYHIAGDLRFISHEDTLRLFRRAIARAALPVRFSEGFNPQPRVRILLPRPVGIASRDEAILIEFIEDLDPKSGLQALAEQMPPALTLTSVRSPEPGERFHLAHVTYRIDPEAQPPDDIDDRIRELGEAEAIPTNRVRHRDGRKTTIDLRVFLVSIRRIGDAVEFTLRVSPEGTAKPAEIATALGYEQGAINHYICRTEVRWLQESQPERQQ